MDLITYPQMPVATLAIRKLRELKIIERSPTGYQLTVSGKVAVGFPALNITARLFLATVDAGSNSSDLMINMACLLSFPSCRLVKIKGSLRPAEIQEPFTVPANLHAITDLGDLWLELWWLDKCLSIKGFENVPTHPAHSLDENVFILLSDARDQLKTHLGKKRTTLVNPASKNIENLVLDRLIEVLQWQLFDVEHGMPGSHLSSYTYIHHSVNEPTIVNFMHAQEEKRTVLYLHIVHVEYTYFASHLLSVPVDTWERSRLRAGSSIATKEDYASRLRKATEPITSADQVDLE